MKCCICEKEIEKEYDGNSKLVWDEGHNAEPVKEGRCCTVCNFNVVIPKRIEMYMGDE